MNPFGNLGDIGKIDIPFLGDMGEFTTSITQWISSIQRMNQTDVVGIICIGVAAVLIIISLVAMANIAAQNSGRRRRK